MEIVLFRLKTLTKFLAVKHAIQQLKQVVSMSRVLKCFLITSQSVILGCYLNASITDLNPKNPDGSPIFKVDNPGGSEFVSGSDQYLMTQVRRYQIMSSAGSYNREIKVKTPKGYSLYSSVQGALISGQEGVR